MVMPSLWNIEELPVDWVDPYPAPVIGKYEGIHVVRDDLLEGGSKQRFGDYLLSDPLVKEWVYGSSPATGYAQVALSAVCKKYNKKAVIFMANRAWDKLTNLQLKAINLGADMKFVPNGMLSVTQKRAKDYVRENIRSRKLLPIGFDHPTVIASIVRVANKMDISPKEVWTVGSSGTLTRGLQQAWPNAEFHCVMVGHKGDYGRAKIYKSDLKFDKPVKLCDNPPFPSAPTYDAKAWKFVREHASPDALFWNVGS
jgi:hypothetical protein